MTRRVLINKIATYIISLVWLINGLVCKILNVVPRHGLIVAKILGDSYSREFTLVIGIAETAMAAWVISRVYSQLCALTQITVVLSMNLLEFFLVPDLLLWGKTNLIFAIGFCVLIYVNEFILNRDPATKTA